MAGVQLEKLTLASLCELDPRIETLFQKHVANVAQDCMNRPGEKNKRRVVLEFLVEPQIDPETGECDEVKLSLEGKSKVPTFHTKAFPMRVSKGGLLFNREVPEDLNQPGLFENDERVM